jgi:hypothetical protein
MGMCLGSCLERANDEEKIGVESAGHEEMVHDIDEGMLEGRVVQLLALGA